MNKKLYIFALVFCLLGIKATPLFAGFEQDTARLNVILRYLPEHLYTESEKCKDLIDEGLEITAWEGLEREKAYLLNQLGLYYNLQANYRKAVDAFDASFLLSTKTGDYAQAIDNLNNKGSVYQAIGNYTVALKNFQKAEYLVDSIPLSAKKPITLTNLGKINRLIGNYFTAIENFERAIRYAIKEGQGVELANAYQNMGETYEKLKEWTNASEFYRKVISLAEDGSIPFDPTNTYASLAGVLEKQGLVNQALYFHQNVLEITREKGYAIGSIQSLLGIGTCYLRKGDYPRAERYLVEGIFEARAHGRQDVADECYFKLASAYEKQGKLAKALHITRVGAALRDSIKSAETNRQLIEMQTMYENEKKKRQFANLEKENLAHEARIENKTMAIVFMSTLMILLILLVILYSNYASVKAENNKILEKLVSERTLQLHRKEKILTAQNKKLMTYAHMTSHSLRKPLANILGVVNWIEADKVEAMRNKEEIYEMIKQSAQELDETIIESIDVLSQDFVVDEEDLEDKALDEAFSSQVKTIGAS